MANKPLSLRLSQQTIDAMDEICKQEGIKGRAALIEVFVRDYQRIGALTNRVVRLEQGQVDHSQRIEALESQNAQNWQG